MPYRSSGIFGNVYNVQRLSINAAEISAICSISAVSESSMCIQLARLFNHQLLMAKWRSRPAGSYYLPANQSIGGVAGGDGAIMRGGGAAMANRKAAQSAAAIQPAQSGCHSKPSSAIQPANRIMWRNRRHRKRRSYSAS